MKKIIFIFAIFTFLFSCSNNKNLYAQTSAESPTYGSTYFVSQNMAEAMIAKFKDHQFRGFFRNRKKLENAYSTFDLTLLKKIMDDYPNLASLKFVMAAGIVKGESDYKAPFVLLRVQLKDNSSGGTVKGGATGNIRIPAPQYYRPIGICPPPYGDCRLSGQ